MYSKVPQNILAIGAHFDDFELGCGGTLYKMVKNNLHVFGLVLTDSCWRSPNKVEQRDRAKALEEGRKAAELLGIQLLDFKRYEALSLDYNDNLVSAILGFIEKYDIDTVFTHWINDAHQDHYAAAKASITACKHVPRVLMYRSNWYDSAEVFRGNIYSDISNEFSIKIQAIDCYASELTRTKGIWKIWIENECRINGLRIGCEFAEYFESIKFVI